MAAIAALVDSSPDALNTLNELAAALGNDPNFATTMTNALAGKQPKDATLTALAELATSADKLPYFTGADRAALTALTSVGRAILGKTSTQGVLDYLGLGEAAKSRVLQSGGDSVKDVMSQNAITYLLSLKAGVNGERVEAENFREALNLGNAALKNTGTGQGQLPDMSAFLSNQEVNGYQYLPGGLILQWGNTPCEDRRTTVSKFPIPFPNECLMVIVCGFQVAGTYQAYTVVNGEWNDQFSWNAFYAQSGNIPVLAAAGQVNARFLAIGK
ncbi:gp53-like domain-containing protein [Escherichia coli]|uniref:gp53-like domain-containing protein n=1 Tax=Escherichia coli TaxID=562 RepID=UPI003D3168C5